MAEVLASVSVTASALAFSVGSSDSSFLAAGTALGSSNPGLLVYRTAAAYVDGALPLIARFPSPAAFCRVAWSSPTEASCYSSALPTGLVAGGLENGLVAVWDPQETLLLEPSDSGSNSSIIENYFYPRDQLRQVHGTTHNLVRATADSDPYSDGNLSGDGRSKLDSDGRWFSSFKVIDDYFSPDGPDPQPPSLDCADLTIPSSSIARSMVSLMSCDSGPVLGLSFSPTTPHFLASGSAEGRVLIWDLINPSAESIPCFQFNEGDDVQISDLSWNVLNPNLIISASNVGVKILDISVKSSVIGKISSMETCSAVEWCPTDKNLVVVASGNYCKVWDVRKVDKPLHQFSDITSIVAMSWCPFEKEIMLACTKEKMVLLNVKEGKVVQEEKARGRCVDVCWSQHHVKHFALATCAEEEEDQQMYDKVEMYCSMSN